MWYARLTAQYAWYFLLLIILAMCGLIRVPTYVKVPLDSSGYEFDTNADPVVFAHLSDIHVSYQLPDAVQRLNESIKIFQEKIHPDMVLITGDLAEQTDVKTFFYDSAPMHEQWIHYSEIMAASGLEYYDVLGNHDVWAILGLDSPANYCVRYSQSGVGDDFYVRSAVKSGVRIVSLQPFRFPQGNGPTGFWATINKEMIEKLDATLSEETENVHTTIFASHHSSDTLWPQSAVSSKGNNFKDLTKQFSAMLNGHKHPHEPIIQHWGHTIEYTATSIKEDSIYQLITFDNRRIAYHWFDISTENPAVVTMPVNYRQTLTNFIDFKEVRVVAFTDEEVKFTVSGDVNGVMTRTRMLKDGVWLYTLPAENLASGLHKIHVSGGSLDTDIEFWFGSEGEGFFDKNQGLLNCWALTVCLVLLALIFGIIFFGMFSYGSFRKPFKDTIKWMEGDNSTGSHWLLCIFAGPLIIGNSMKKLPLAIKAVLVAAVAWGYTLPSSFFKVEDTVGVMWAYGYIIDGKLVLDFVYMIFPALYLGCICFALICALSLYDRQPNKSYIFDFVMIALLVGISEFVWCYYGAGASDDFYWLASFEFFIFPLLFIAMCAVLYYMRCTCNVQARIDADENDITP